MESRNLLRDITKLIFILYLNFVLDFRRVCGIHFHSPVIVLAPAYCIITINLVLGFFVFLFSPKMM